MDDVESRREPRGTVDLEMVHVETGDEVHEDLALVEAPRVDSELESTAVSTSVSKIAPVSHGCSVRRPGRQDSQIREGERRWWWRDERAFSIALRLIHLYRGLLTY